MTAGIILKEIESNLLGLDDEGNLLLNTTGGMAGQIYNSTVPAFGGLGIPTKVSISNASGTSNISNITFQVADLAGNAVSGNFCFEILLSDAATGLGLTGQSPSSAAAGSGGTVLESITANKNLKVQTVEGGKFVLAVTDAGKNGYYPVAYFGGRAFIGSQLTSSSYG